MWSAEYLYYTHAIHLVYSQYSIHHTRLRESPSGFVECNVRAKLQEIADITDLGTEDMRIIYSPGFIIENPPRLENKTASLLSQRYPVVGIGK